MLELRPNCELCDRDLPPASPNARICTYECTYCAHCAEAMLENVCPTCGGNFVPLPVRPTKAWRAEMRLGLGHHPPSRRRHSRWSADAIRALIERLRSVAPHDR